MTDPREQQRDIPVDQEPRVASSAAAPAPTTADPNDDIPVPEAMSPAELDARADAIEAMRELS